MSQFNAIHVKNAPLSLSFTKCFIFSSIGISPLSQMCRMQHSCTLAEDSGFFSAYPIAHEIMHRLVGSLRFSFTLSLVKQPDLKLSVFWVRFHSFTSGRQIVEDSQLPNTLILQRNSLLPGSGPSAFTAYNAYTTGTWCASRGLHGFANMQQ